MRYALVALFFLLASFAYLNGDQHTLPEEMSQLVKRGTELYRPKQYSKASEVFKQALDEIRIIKRIDDDAILSVTICLADSLVRSNRYIESMKYFRELLDKEASINNKNLVAAAYNGMGECFAKLGDNISAKEWYEKTLNVVGVFTDPRKRSYTSNNLGDTYLKMGQYAKAFKLYHDALKVYKKLNMKRDVSINLLRIGSVYNALGNFDLVLERYNEALKNATKIEDRLLTFACYKQIGFLYSEWGDELNANRYFNKILKADHPSEILEQMQISIKSNIFLRNNQYDKAIETEEQLLAYYKQKMEIANVLSAMRNLATFNFRLGRYDEAYEYLSDILNIATNMEMKAPLPDVLNYIGLIYQARRNFKKAIDYHLRALEIEHDIGRRKIIKNIYASLGLAYWSLGDYRKSLTSLFESIENVEYLRETSSGSVRIGYLELEIQKYHLILSNYIRLKKPYLAFNTFENTLGRYLNERLRPHARYYDDSDINIRNFQKKLSGNTAVIAFAAIDCGGEFANFANINNDRSGQFYLDRDKIYSAEIVHKAYLSEIYKKYKDKLIKSYENISEVDDPLLFERLVRYYRRLLLNPKPEDEDIDIRNEIGSKLFSFLFSNIEEFIKDKNELIIIPEGVLTLVPFETLILPNGQYLVEKYNVKYIQSLSVFEKLNTRSYPKDREALIAFGGAIYESDDPEKHTDSSPTNKAYFEKELTYNINRGNSLRNTYSAFGFSKWNNLPGTEEEIARIKSIIPNSKILKGTEVTESNVKLLSKSGDLKKYKVIHFATHGIAIQEIPELSALVLSQIQEELGNGEDGYLTVKEIAELDIRADFVNLSACETGLGKIYSGEGVVGMTQAFLIAGANGLSVSLWQVADESTMEFMVGLYRLVQEKALSYDRAMTEMKRKFIREGKYSDPFYWAPFVYYGR